MSEKMVQIFTAGI